jgi:hypothetical protein
MSHGYAQNSIEKVLFDVEQNNTTLKFARDTKQAEEYGNKTGIYLQNPEFGFNYLWGDPAETGPRKDIFIVQSFDFPTAYSWRREIAVARNRQVDLKYQQERRQILFQTRQVCLDLIYNNVKHKDLLKRYKGAQDLAQAYQVKFESGETGILEYNKAQLDLMVRSGDLDACVMERSGLLTTLEGLNGGLSVEFSDTIFPVTPLPVDFEAWYGLTGISNPVLAWLIKETEIGQIQEKLSKALILPGFEAGYMREQVVGQQFQGVTFGMTIPLWEQKNTLKYARARTIAGKSAEADFKQQYFTRLKALHGRAVSLQNRVMQFQEKMKTFNNTILLKKALDQGEISLTSYLLELTLYYEFADKLRESELELNKTMAELMQYQ